jgi:hypothetical protein
MGRAANFEVVLETKSLVLIEDLGPWDVHFTVTNDPESVVAKLAPMLSGRPLFYIDSDGRIDELKVRDGKFAGFAPGEMTRDRRKAARYE